MGHSGCLPEPVAKTYFSQLMQAVQHCHQRGVAHRDIKLENIGVAEDGVLKLLDFGLAKPNQSQHSRLHDLCGSKNYLAPEVSTLGPNGYNGFVADVWSCGIVLFAMLAGFFPLEGTSASDWRFQEVLAAQRSG